MHVSCVGNSLACCLSSGPHGALPPYQLSTCSGIVRKLRRLRGEVPWSVGMRSRTMTLGSLLLTSNSSILPRFWSSLHAGEFGAIIMMMAISQIVIEVCQVITDYTNCTETTDQLTEQTASYRFHQIMCCFDSRLVKKISNCTTNIY